jgi:prepilin signal peptidase PulO-like enzyme (type II secretory pathway)
MLTLLLICIFIALILHLAYLDLKTGYLPDRYTLILLWIGLLGNPYLPWVNLQQALWGAALGYMFFWSVYWLCKVLCQKEGLGYGDFKYLAALGAWFGWEQLPLIVFLATVSTLIISLGYRYSRKQALPLEIPLGPGLSFAGLSLLLYAIDFYLI